MTDDAGNPVAADVGDDIAETLICKFNEGTRRNGAWDPDEPSAAPLRRHRGVGRPCGSGDAEVSVPKNPRSVRWARDGPWLPTESLYPRGGHPCRGGANAAPYAGDWDPDGVPAPSRRRRSTRYVRVPGG